MKVLLVQENPTVGDIEGNIGRLQWVVQSHPEADLIVFPELFLTGYPPYDLLLSREFLRKTQEGLGELKEFSRGCPQAALVVGMPWQEGEALFNAAVVLRGGSILGVQQKRRLTPFRLFHEERYFTPGEGNLVLELQGRTLGFALGMELDGELTQELKNAGVDLIINPCAIPYRVGAETQQLELLSTTAAAASVSIIRVGQVGANDGLIFPGGSFALGQQGRVAAALPQFQEASRLIDLDELAEPVLVPKLEEPAAVFQALALGLRDYVRKCGMKQVILGLSGGLDSAVSACLAVEAVGADRVWAIAQPGPYSSPGSVVDAEALAGNLGIRFDVISITELYDAVLSTLDEHFAGTEMNVAEENIQARLRGNLWMALSNKFGGLVLANSNKSELAVGYCTLYGDMCGGMAPIADIYKTMVYDLARYINREREIIPWSIINKPPSAELRPNQRDEDSLPPYEILDGILAAYLDERLDFAEIVSRGYAEETVRWVIRTVEYSEYKRRQAALILRITTPILGWERAMPLAGRKMV